MHLTAITSRGLSLRSCLEWQSLCGNCKRSAAPRNKTLSLKAILLRLPDAEQADRQARGLRCQLKTARFPACKDLSGFNFAANEVNEALLSQFHRCGFMDAAENVVLIGGPEAGKSLVATAIGIQATRHHCKRVRFF